MAADNQPNVPPETSAETPAVSSTPLKTTVDLTSHLANVTLPASEAEGDEAATAAEEDFKLPKTLKGTLELIAEGNNQQPTNAADAKRIAAIMEKLRAHAHALSQGAHTPVIYGKNHAALVSVSSNHAEEIHLKLLSRTDRIIADRLQRDEATIEDLKKKLADAEAQLAKLAQLTAAPK